MKSKSFLLASALLILGACRGRTPDEENVAGPVPPPAAAFAVSGESMRLEDRLARLERQLARIERHDIDDEAKTQLMAAEAQTDRLLEAEPPVQWLASDYSLEARLRQLQALADRIVAVIRRGEDDASLPDDVRALRREVTALRRDLARPGGGRAPVSLDSLLAAVRMDVQPAAEGLGGE
jgi:hypothetical protein